MPDPCPSLLLSSLFMTPKRLARRHGPGKLCRCLYCVSDIYLFWWDLAPQTRLAFNLQASCSDDRFAPLCPVPSEHLGKRVCTLELYWASKVPWRHDSLAGASEPDEVGVGSRSSLRVWWRIYLWHSHFQAVVSDSILRHPGVCVPEN